MRRTMLSMLAVAAIVVGVGSLEPQEAQAAPYFGFSIGTPAYYPYGYPAAYPYAGPQASLYGSIPLAGPRCGLQAYPYGGYYRGFYGRPSYGPYGYGHGHHRW